ncbi:general secretion pathway protein GspB [Shewanella eurypsychrophilus]|uniref:General secretion pathway protein GspB n=1 Tax=Shewanella eurypsychrophilus TaxID=2593656 RepID=A0ABX6V5X9_9GAMM|nr:MULTISPECIES: general secretion pathway protein GspB [Shewanella]QFU21651.1 general secretion pathway protein GspB [Shewanella sp. YLB-09]QPG56941.1 general secretion pathway protein GspB [Shewanella eurypsychrophilus]
MSILLDAVTRAKQQESDSLLDPVLTPRAQYDSFAGSNQRVLVLMCASLVVFLLLVIAWLGSRAFFSESNQEPTEQLVAAVSLHVEQTTQAVNDPKLVEAEANVQSVRLAGKVTLPLATERPQSVRQVQASSFATATVRPNNNQVINTQVINRQVEQYSQSNATSYPGSEPSSYPSSEPIILGANANQKGQDMLASLKFQVDAAAAEVGLENSPKNYKSENNLLAAFEAALKEVEVKNSLTRPVTPAELDPIPTPKPDELPKYGQLPAGIQLQIPEFNINAHVYSSDPNNRWLNVDGAELQEGDTIGGKLEIIEIRPRDIVLAIQGTQFKVPAI